MSRSLDFDEFDSMMDEEKLRVYSQTASQILETSVFTGEINRLISQWTKEAVCSVNSFEQLRDLQCYINALVLLEDRMKSIAAYSKRREIPAEDPFSEI